MVCGLSSRGRFFQDGSAALCTFPSHMAQHCITPLLCHSLAAVWH